MESHIAFSPSLYFLKRGFSDDCFIRLLRVREKKENVNFAASRARRGSYVNTMFRNFIRRTNHERIFEHLHVPLGAHVPTRIIVSSLAALYVPLRTWIALLKARSLRGSTRRKRSILAVMRTRLLYTSCLNLHGGWAAKFRLWKLQIINCLKRIPFLTFFYIWQRVGFFYEIYLLVVVLFTMPRYFALCRLEGKNKIMYFYYIFEYLYRFHGLCILNIFQL